MASSKGHRGKGSKRRSTSRSSMRMSTSSILAKGSVPRVKLNLKTRSNRHPPATPTSTDRHEALPTMIDMGRRLQGQQPYNNLDEDYQVRPSDAHSDAKRTRRVRAVKAPRYNDAYLFGSELDEEIDMSALRDTAGRESDLDGEEVRTSPLLSILTIQQQSSKRKSDQCLKPSDPALLPALPKTDFVHRVDNSVYDILNSLQGSSSIHIELPDLSSAADPDIELPYTAQFLMQLYLVCYNSRQWNLCDLVVDTWIRAFHALRNRARRDPQYQIWRPNRVLEARMKISDKQREARPFDTLAPKFALHVEDPLLHSDVTSFDAMVLNDLYENTPPDCGARLLWADAMALMGDRLENAMQRGRLCGREWHQDLKHNIMCTSLRMVRRKLTLKIEEDTEGAWCRRYHEHSKHNMLCYREEARQRKVGGQDANNRSEEAQGREGDEGDKLVRKVKGRSN